MLYCVLTCLATVCSYAVRRALSPFFASGVCRGGGGGVSIYIYIYILLNLFISPLIFYVFCVCIHSCFTWMWTYTRAFSVSTIASVENQSSEVAAHFRPKPCREISLTWTCCVSFPAWMLGQRHGQLISGDGSSIAGNFECIRDQLLKQSARGQVNLFAFRAHCCDVCLDH